MTTTTTATADSEIRAFLVSASQHLSDAEVVALARVRTRFSPIMRWDRPIVVDKHSMGGVPGSRITLIVVPIVAAQGLLMPKTSSRAITSPADMSSSILADREAGRPLEWDIRNGVMQRRGRAHGIATPISDVLVPLLAASSDSPA